MSLSKLSQCSPPTEKTYFERAWDEYVATLTNDKEQGFIQKCLQAASGLPDDRATSINQSLVEIVDKKAESASQKVLGTYVRPVVDTLKGFYGIIDTLTSSNTIASISWGCVKLLLDTVGQYAGLLDTIQSQLKTLQIVLSNVTQYDQLYRGDEKMQQLLCQTYISVIGFWRRVDKECSRYSTFIKSSRSAKKLDDISKKIEGDVSRIKDRADVLSKVESRTEYTSYQAARAAAEEATNLELVRRCLSSKVQNLSHVILPSKKARRITKGTCEWLSDDVDFIKWQNDGSPPILWLYGPPGCGKSTLCSYAIQSVEKLHPCRSAYHFCDFAQPYEAEQIYARLAQQLLEQYWNEFQKVPPQMLTLAATSSLTDLIELLVKDCSKVFVFLDGLDEETSYSRWKEVAEVIQFLTELTTKFSSVRLWCSTQYYDKIAKALAGCVVLDITQHAKQDVNLFLRQAVSQFDDLQNLDVGRLDRVDCNFVLATLIMEDLENNATSLGSVKELLEGLYPESLDAHYRRMFKRLDKALLRLACNVFSLIVYAKRPLRLSELREAVWCLQRKYPDSLRVEDKPFDKSVGAVFHPFIELVSTTSGDHARDDAECRLFHSTLRLFLVKCPDVLCTPDRLSEPFLSPDVPARACLSYLGLSRYSELMNRQDTRWVDKEGSPVEHHNFLAYAAKYWDKHLDDVEDPKKRQELSTRIDSFIRSPNFGTCMQVQSLWVEGQFSVYRVQDMEGVRHLRRVFPTWFVQAPGPGRMLWSEYRYFLHEWKYLLACGNCDHSSGCEVRPYTGQLDRVWFGALGPGNFLSESKSRYASFALLSNQDLGVEAKSIFGCVGIDVAGSQITLLHIWSTKDRVENSASSARGGTVLCTFETWHFPAQSSPECRKVQRMKLDKRILDLYRDDGPDTMSKSKVAQATFAPDCQTVRIGNRIFMLNDSGDFVPIRGLSEMEGMGPGYVEDFARRERFLVLASRTRRSGRKADGRSDEDAGGESDKEDEELSENSDDSDWDSDDQSDGYESASEASTVYSDDLFEYDGITPWYDPYSDDEGSDDDEDDTSSEDVDSDASESSSVSDDMPDSNSEFEEEIEDDRARFLNHAHYREEDDHDWDDLPLYIPDMPTKGRVRAKITIYDMHDRSPIFHFHRRLKCDLYVSPPVFHPDPKKSLVVWPLADGDVLFVDFHTKRHFIRRLRPSTTHTRHVFMKCHFSACGEFLHIAALEGQRIVSKDASTTAANVKLAVLVSTYRLSQRKTTRSPPTLINRVRLEIGETNKLVVSNLPYTLTWTCQHLHLTVSGRTLQVYRVPLFSNGKAAKIEGDEQAVERPGETFFLPETAAKRNVYYFPRMEGIDGSNELPARIIVGPGNAEFLEETQVTDEEECPIHAARHFVTGVKPCPPTCCYVNEDELGGWVDSHTRTKIQEQRGVGILDVRMEGVERFDPDEDCDLEPYIF
ncbi:hypothetical protein HYDPIDRAFT_189153 [Hydnomerulius pinastri MD-312]|uniref:NACHT domain-containing protein n=1 Tax=Hydnomerulius pinastri MD-312 TaxID=994086 RepID=A0A0C9WCP6_9AGAM|nr:hypothetical protein HYDPIDRAFT_189153 [Hydnomerulius pinastri MD-312]